jgi:tRNA threonylcarbamoyladenosine biosynthesis protein TsaE
MRKKIIREWKKVYESDLQYFAYELKDLADTPSVILLDGKMGAGKTTFAKSFIKDGDTFSPSYSVLSETRNVLHADLYRIEDREEIIHIELPLYLESKQYFLVEWGEKYLHTLYKETPEDYSYYNLEITINETIDDNDSKPDQNSSRNFTLSEISEID